MTELQSEVRSFILMMNDSVRAHFSIKKTSSFSIKEVECATLLIVSGYVMSTYNMQDDFDLSEEFLETSIDTFTELWNALGYTGECVEFGAQNVSNVAALMDVMQPHKELPAYYDALMPFDQLKQRAIEILYSTAEHA